MVISHPSSRCYPFLVFHMFTVVLPNHVIFRIVFSTSFVLDVGRESLSAVSRERGLWFGGSVIGGRFGFVPKKKPQKF